nr:PTS system protein [Raoultella sp. NCTC 9187]
MPCHLRHCDGRDLYLTWFIGFEDIPQESDDASAAPSPAASAHAAGDTAILSPLRGQVVALSEVNDDVFSGGLLGQGWRFARRKGA